MPESIHDQIERERKAAIPDPEVIETYRRYARGAHDKVMSADQMRQIAGMTKHAFADNACGKILALIASRLEFTGWAVEDSGMQDFLDTLYTKNQLADQQYNIHYATARDGNHAVVLGWQAPRLPGEKGRVIIHRERWWNGKSGIWIAKGEDRRPVYAVKDFHVMMGDPPKLRQRRTIYFADHLEKYLRVGAGWEPFGMSDPDNPEVTLPRIPWTKRSGAPLGLPVVHFANGENDDSPYGMSDLDGGVIGLQDHLNDVHWDITVASRLTGFPMITATGYSPEVIGGVRQPMRTGPGTLLSSANTEAKFGVITPGDLKGLIDVYELKLRALASNTQTPEHVITGSEWPSGLALIRAEMPLIDKVKRLAKTHGPSWQEVGHRASEIANAFGPPGLNEDALITAQFADPERLDAQAKAEADKLQLDVWVTAAAIEDPVILAKTGLFTPAEIRKLTADREKRAEQQMLALTGAAGGGPAEDDQAGE